jgi:thiol-disulfide isomerase/thioredoxin
MRFNCIPFVLAGSVSLLFLSACGPAGKPEKKEVASSSANASAASAPAAPGADTAASEVLTDIDPDLLKPAARQEKSEGDTAWIDLQKALQPPTYPEAWREKRPSEEEVAAFEKKSGLLAAEAAQKAKDFYSKYPDHQMAARARQMEFALVRESVKLGNTNQIARLDELETQKLKEPNLPEEERFALRAQQLQRRIDVKQQESTTASLNEMEKGVRELQKEFPGREEINSLLLAVAQGRLEQDEPDKARQIAQEVLKSNAEKNETDEATSLLKRLDMLGKPLALKYTALDGRQIDVQQMKGKVILVDFWATWCGPCMAKLPEVKEAYQKLHEKGFEIAGISSDLDKEVLEKVIKKEGIAWPQYLDGDGGGPQFGKEFDVPRIPTLWLVDKKGILRDVNAHDDLEKRVEKLLAEK